MFARAALAALAAGAIASAAAQTGPDWRATLEKYYRYDVAFDHCGQVAPEARDMLRLENAIAFGERASGLEEDYLDAIYASVERQAHGEPASFCADMEDAVAAVRALPQDHR
jgi:hypothetical protein